MPDLDLSALRKVAEAATPGPWSALGTGRSGGDHWYVCDEGEAIASISAQDGINEAQREPDATHMATFDPPTVLALLDELERLQREARGPKFSERLAMAQQAWDEYRSVAKLIEPEAPTLFSAGYTMGISHGYQRRRP